MVGAYVVYLSREHGVVPRRHLRSDGSRAAIGAATHLLVMRRCATHRRCPARGTLGILTVCVALGEQLWGNGPRLVKRLLPTDSVTLFDDVVVGGTGC